MEPLRGLERANKPAPKTHEPLTKKAVKNLKRNKRRSDKCRTKCGAPKLAPSPALEMAKTTLRKASQEKVIFCGTPLNGKLGFQSVLSAIPISRLRRVPIRKGTPIRKASANRATTQLRQARVPSLVPRQARVSTLAPRQVWIPASTRNRVEPSIHP